MASPIKFGAAFFTEDIREETSGKLMMIGTFTGAFRSTRNPGNLYLHLVTIFRASEPGEAKAELLVKIGEKQLADAEFTVSAARAGNVFCAFPSLPIEDISSETELRVEIKVDDGEWEIGFQSPVIVPEPDEKQPSEDDGSSNELLN